MSEHTPGKLVVRGGYSIYTADDKTPVADTCLTNSVPDNDEANARRIVAAWNWCDGLSTQNLEDNVSAKELAHRYNAVTIERDYLRAVNAELVRMLEKARSGLSNGLWDYGPGQDEHAQCDELIEEVDAAIASARKQGEQG